MNALIILSVLVVGFTIFVLLFYGVAKLFLHKKSHDQKMKYISRANTINFKVNKPGSTYSFK
jgi:hypothetical protein